MVQGAELIIIISASTGIISDLIFLLLYFKIPFVKHAIGLNLIAISVFWNILFCTLRIIFLPSRIYKHGMLYPAFFLINYTFFTQFSYAILYIYYIYKIICKKVSRESISIKKLILVETLFTLVFVSLIVFPIIIYKEISDLPNKNLVFLICYSIVYGMYFIPIIISVVLCCKIYAELKSKYLQLKNRPCLDFCRLVSFSISIFVVYISIVILSFTVKLDQSYFPEFQFLTNMTSVFLLGCLFISQEMKDGIRFIKEKKNEINYRELK